MHQSEEKKYTSKMSLDQFLISKYNVRAMCFQFNYFEMLAIHPYKTFPNILLQNTSKKFEKHRFGLQENYT